MLGFLLSKQLCFLIGYLLPTYATFKLFRSEANLTIQNAKGLLHYWACLAIWTVAEFHFDYIIYWLPFYYEAKVVSLLWLTYGGSTFVYERHLEPRLVDFEPSIDQISTNLRNSFLQKMKELIASSFVYLRDWIANALSQKSATTSSKPSEGSLEREIAAQVLNSVNPDLISNALIGSVSTPATQSHFKDTHSTTTTPTPTTTSSTSSMIPASVVAGLSEKPVLTSASSTTTSSSTSSSSPLSSTTTTATITTKETHLNTTTPITHTPVEVASTSTTIAATTTTTVVKPKSADPTSEIFGDILSASSNNNKLNASATVNPLDNSTTTTITQQSQSQQQPHSYSLRNRTSTPTTTSSTTTTHPITNSTTNSHQPTTHSTSHTQHQRPVSMPPTTTAPTSSSVFNRLFSSKK